MLAQIQIRSIQTAKMYWKSIPLPKKNSGEVNVFQNLNFNSSHEMRELLLSDKKLKKSPFDEIERPIAHPICM